MNQARGVVVIGGTEFWIPESIPLSELVPGVSVTPTYEVTGGKAVATVVRTTPR